jgi:hypothetical protein
MKGRIRPIADARDETVFERIDVTIFDMARIIRLFADYMLSKPALPYATFVTRTMNWTESFLLWQRSCKAVLDQPPTGGEVRIVRRQAPDGVQMIGEHDKRVDRKRIISTSRGNGFAQNLDMIDEQFLTAVQQIDLEEPATTWNEGTTIVRHAM